MPKVIMGMGIPGSGKTTVLKKFASDYGYSYICPDDIRLELLGDAKDQSKNKEVWDEAYSRLGKYLKEGSTVVFDATFADARARENCIRIAREHGANKIHGIKIDISMESAKDRNSKRERIVPEYVLERMHKNLDSNPPKIDEGFDSIFTIDKYHQLIKAESKIKQEVINREFKGKLR